MQSITVNKPGCVVALETLKRLTDAGVLAAGNWDEKIQSNNAGTVATQMYGGWYEGTVRSTAPEDQAGKWGVYPMPSVTADGSTPPTLAARRWPSHLPRTARRLLSPSETRACHQRGAGEDAQGIRARSFAAHGDRGSVRGEAQPFWGGQAVWQTILEPLPRWRQPRHALLR
jgi:lactose/L-arabinose transport system substrate-binding protein